MFCCHTWRRQKFDSNSGIVCGKQLFDHSNIYFFAPLKTILFVFLCFIYFYISGFMSFLRNICTALHISLCWVYLCLFIFLFSFLLCWMWDLFVSRDFFFFFFVCHLIWFLYIHEDVKKKVKGITKGHRNWASKKEWPNKDERMRIAFVSPSLVDSHK